MDAAASPDSRSYLIADLPAHERPRERLLRVGADALSDAELLAIVLKNGLQGRSALDLARDLLGQFDHDLAALAAASPTDLARTRGIGPAKACELKASFELALRLAASVGRPRRRLAGPETVADYLRERFRACHQEELHVLILDAKNHLVRDEVVTVGLLDRSQVHSREVFRVAIEHRAARVILAHNHPSGDPAPSVGDMKATAELVAAGQVVGIEVVDHIVIGRRTADRPRDYYSFQEHNLIRRGRAALLAVAGGAREERTD